MPLGCPVKEYKRMKYTTTTTTIVQVPLSYFNCL